MEEEGVFSPEQLENLFEAYNAFKDGQTGLLMPYQIETALRAMGCNPTPEEVEDIQEDAKNGVNFKTFAYIAYRHSRAVDVVGELVESFAVFDRNSTGVLPVSEIRKILKGIKNPFTDDQITEILDKVNYTNDNVNYAEFVEAMVQS